MRPTLSATALESTVCRVSYRRWYGNDASSVLHPMKALYSAATEEVLAPRDREKKAAGVCEEIYRVTQEELRAEVERDRKSSAAVPPLPPVGWAVQHPPGTRYLVLHKSLSSASSSLPRYRSVLQEALRLHQRHRGERPRETEEAEGTAPRSTGTRLQTHLSLYAPFRVRDLSLLERSLSVTEWVGFDVLVRKSPLTAQVAYLLPHQRRLWDDRQCMLLRLASVQSEVRIRAVQFLTQSVARRLGESAALGRGDPLFLALQEELQRREGHSKSLLLQHTPLGEMARGMCYHGPYITNISKEFHDSLHAYILSDLGINAELVEFVCQMQYYAEHEEYMSWLARLGMAAEQFTKISEE